MFGVHRSGNSAFIVTLSDLRQSFLLPTSLHDFYRYIRTEFYSSSYQRRPYGRVLFLMRGQELNVLVQKLSKAHSFIVPHQGSPARRQFLTSAIFPDDKEHPESVILIQSCDTAFFGTTYGTTADDASRSPFHVSMNFYGGRPRFIHSQPSDKRTLILSDFSGNGIMTPLGNAETTLSLSLSLSLVSFVTGYIFIPFSNAQGRLVQRSPYSLPVRYSDEESVPVLWFDDSSPATATQKHCLPQLDHCHVYLGMLSQTGHHIQPSHHPQL